MAQIKIKTKAGDITIDFKDNKDLELQLSKIDFSELQNIITKKIPSSFSVNSDLIEEYKDLYRLNSSGSVILTKIPQKKTDAIKLAIYLSEKGLTTKEIKISTGVTKPKSYMDKKDFIQDGDSFSLQADSRKEVLEKIIPKLRS